MKTQPRPEGALSAGSARADPSHGINGEPVRRSAASADVRLYRYQPVPPVYRDADGYLLEDGMGQTNPHLTQTTRWFHALTRHLPTATVCSDLPLHYELGDTGATLVPDLFVALQVPPNEDREDYRLWENPVPDLVIEMLSKTTSKNDIGLKQNTYEHLGIREYWLFDPKGFELPQPLTGYRLQNGRYRQIDADGSGRFPSEVLGLELHARASELRFHDPATGEDLRTLDEAEDRADAAERRAEAAERELARLRLRLDAR